MGRDCENVPIDSRTIAEGYDEYERAGVDRLGRRERMNLAARACTDGLRRMWCGIFKLGEADTFDVLRREFPPEAQWNGKATI